LRRCFPNENQYARIDIRADGTREQVRAQRAVPQRNKVETPRWGVYPADSFMEGDDGRS
jgi:hypothetical protein